MRALVIPLLMLLTAMTNVTIAAELPADECARWRAVHAGAPAITVNHFTREQAEHALHRIDAMITGNGTPYRFDSAEYHAAEALIRGYLLRKELLDARRLRQHDADEVQAFCEHWARVAYGQ